MQEMMGGWNSSGGDDTPYSCLPSIQYHEPEANAYLILGLSDVGGQAVHRVQNAPSLENPPTQILGPNSHCGLNSQRAGDDGPGLPL